MLKNRLQRSGAPRLDRLAQRSRRRCFSSLSLTVNPHLGFDARLKDSVQTMRKEAL
jgi:hypothetical protein